jgi:hypothetical protein
MIERATVRRLLVFLFVCTVTLSASSVFAEDPPAVTDLVQINKRALDDYDKKDWQSAKRRLWEAIGEAKSAGIETHPIVARTYLHLGAVYLVGLKDREAAVLCFGHALQIDPTIRVAKAMLTSEIAGAFLEAQTTLGIPRRAKDGISPLTQGQPQPSAEQAPPPSAPSDGAALDCPNTDDVVRDNAATIRCTVAPTLKVGSVALFFRVPGAGKFTSVDMKKTGRNTYVGQISKDVTGGKSVQFYVEGRDQNGKPIVANGNSGSPNLMLVREDAETDVAAASVAPPSPQSNTDDHEENPLDAAPGAVVHRAGAASRSAGASPKWWIGLGVGSGFGYAKGNGLENRKDLQPNFDSGIGWAGLGQASPEVGLHINPSLALAIEGRNQWIPQSGTGSKGYATSANAALLRLLFFSAPNRLRFYGGPVAGYGTFRFVFNPDPHDSGTKDTVKGGLVVLGGGAGLSYGLTHVLALAVETNVLMGYSAFSAVCDLNAGLQVNFY